MEIKLLVGLGNPGKEFENTYHNVGQLFIDYLKTDPKPPIPFLPAGRRANLQKTDVYMNESGRYVKAALKKYRLRPEEIVVVHDDSDIPLGSFKLSFGRGSAGHQGIESIISALKTNKFHRLRIGIRSRRERQRKKANELVLKKIPPGERKNLNNLFRDIGSKMKGKAYPAAGLRRNS